MESSSNPTVTVEEVTKEREQILTTHAPGRVNLGGDHSPQALSIEGLLGSLTRASRGQGGRVFQLTWKGDKIPRGAEILGHRISWTQNGQVLSEDGTQMGTYERLVEFGGPDRKDQKMLVYASPMIAPPIVEATK